MHHDKLCSRHLSEQRDDYNEDVSQVAECEERDCNMCEAEFDRKYSRVE